MSGPHAHAAPGPGRIAFLTGCGRSGTTILGKVLSRHPDIAYANDRFALWIEPFPFADVWGRLPGRSEAEPRVALDESDAAAAGPEARGRFLASLDGVRGGKRMLVEKVAVNNFRLGFLAALVPDARVINSVRHGVEVARSIARRAQAGRWYGPGGSKRGALERHAQAVGLGHLLDLCTTDYARALLEWRMSVEAAERFRRLRPDVPWLSLRYEDFLNDPVSTAAAVAGFLGLAPSGEMERFAAWSVRRQSPSALEGGVPTETRLIAGDAHDRLGYAALAESAP
jgi:hypothetical protein